MGRSVAARRRNALSSSANLTPLNTMPNSTIYRRARTRAMLMLYDVFFDADTRALEMLNALVFTLRVTVKLGGLILGYKFGVTGLTGTFFLFLFVDGLLAATQIWAVLKNSLKFRLVANVVALSTWVVHLSLYIWTLVEGTLNPESVRLTVIGYVPTYMGFMILSLTCALRIIIRLNAPELFTNTASVKRAKLLVQLSHNKIL